MKPRKDPQYTLFQRKGSRNIVASIEIAYMKTITRSKMLEAMKKTSHGIMRASWKRRTDKIDKHTGEVIEPAGTVRNMRFCAYTDKPKKNWTPAGGYFANAPTAAAARRIKREHSLVVVYPVEGEKPVEEQRPKAIPWSDVFEFVCFGQTYRVKD